MVAALGEHGCTMSVLPVADSDVVRLLQTSSHIPCKAVDVDKRSLPIEGTVAYLRILGLTFEAAAVDDCLLKKGLLDFENRILRSR